VKRNTVYRNPNSQAARLFDQLEFTRFMIACRDGAGVACRDGAGVVQEVAGCASQWHRCKERLVAAQKSAAEVCKQTPCTALVLRLTRKP
jgi:hypothetical protein